MVFIDTNILIYRSFGAEAQKKLIDEVLKNHENEIVISTQVLNEFINTSIKRKFFTKEKLLTDTLILFVKNFTVSELTTQTILDAIEIRKRYGYSHYDSLIITSALENNCNILYTEDLQHSQKIKSKLKIINPFKQ